MITFTFGWTFSSVCVSSNARWRSSSLGRMSTSFRSGYFAARTLADVLDPLVLVGRGQRRGDDRELALAAQQPRGVARRSDSAMPCGVAWLTKKSRASVSASASHVTTLMPRRRALRSTVEIASLFSTLTAITSTPRVIQASTTSFCLAGSVSVGPSQSSLTPSSSAASSRALAAAHEVGIALVLGHHGDRRAASVAVAAARVTAPAAASTRRRTTRAASTTARDVSCATPSPSKRRFAPMRGDEQDRR